MRGSYSGNTLAFQAKNSIEQQKKFKEETDALKKAKAEQQAFDNEQKQKKIDDDKANAEKAKAAAEKRKQDKIAEDEYNCK